MFELLFRYFIKSTWRLPFTLEFILNRAIDNYFAISGLFEGDIELNPEQESNVCYKIF